MWLIIGAAPEADYPLHCGPFDVEGETLRPHGGPALPVRRGVPALAAAAWRGCRCLNVPPPWLLLAGDTGRGDGSRAMYAHLVAHAATLAPAGCTFHYLFPDVDWHNRVLMAVRALSPRPLLVADAGFMYVAKMSGYADAYDLFTPDAGEMAFLADEKAPHPFYTRGFLLETDADAPALAVRARRHGNVAKNLIIKGAADHVVDADGRILRIDAPSVPAMEAVGGTGDLVTGLATAFLCAGLPTFQAAEQAARANRLLAALANPTPDTQVAALLPYLPEALAALRRAD